MTSVLRIGLCLLVLFASNGVGGQACPTRECQPNAATVPSNDSIAGRPTGDTGPTQITPGEQREDAIAHGICRDVTCWRRLSPREWRRELFLTATFRTINETDGRLIRSKPWGLVLKVRSIGLALCAGSVTSIISGVAIVWLLGGSRITALSMAPKAVTTPIAMVVSQEIGGPALTAALAILGGIVAAIVGQEMLHGLRIRDWRAHGLAAGVAAAQVASRDQLGAAFAALGIGLNGLLTALLVPILAALWH